MNFSNNQKIQEEQYVLPYHWFLSRDTYRGRVYFSYLDLCFSLISKDKNIKLLDAGCGDAKVLAELNKKKYFNLHGLDYSEKAINFARILLPEVNFISSDLRKINYKSESFDTILLIEVIEHINPVAPIQDQLEGIEKLEIPYALGVRKETLNLVEQLRNFFSNSLYLL